MNVNGRLHQNTSFYTHFLYLDNLLVEYAQTLSVLGQRCLCVRSHWLEIIHSSSTVSPYLGISIQTALWACGAPYASLLA